MKRQSLMKGALLGAVLCPGLTLAQPMPLAELGRRDNMLQPVWQDGRLLKDWGFEEIRARADAAMHW